MRTFDQKSVQDENAHRIAPNQQATSIPDRHQQILQMQRQYGNQAVQRMIQRQEASEEMTLPSVPGTASTPGSSANSIGDGTATITAENGVVDITGAIINLNSAMVNVNAAYTKHTGIDEADTIVANNVVAANYTPGAGNMW